MTIGQRIKERRLAVSLTLKEVAEEIGVKEATMQRYESGSIKTLKQETISKIASVLRVSPQYLMGWDDNKLPEEAIEVTGMVPIVGCIPAGVPVLAEENIEGYMPTIKKNPQEYFALRVHGRSMINAGIPDGCLVLIHQQQEAENGEIVACRVNGDEATLKRFKRNGDNIVLLPENPEFDPIFISNKDFASGYASVIGVVKQVIIDM